MQAAEDGWGKVGVTAFVGKVFGKQIMACIGEHGLRKLAEKAMDGIRDELRLEYEAAKLSFVARPCGIRWYWS